MDDGYDMVEEHEYEVSEEDYEEYGATEKDNGLEVDATMDTEKLKKFMEKLDAWENNEIDSPETQGLKMRVEILETSNPYRGQSNYETLSKIKNFCKGHCVLDIKFFKESETSTYVIVVYKD